MYEFEGIKAATVLVSHLLGVKPGETVVVTVDTGSDLEAAKAISAAVYACGGKPVLVSHICPGTMGKSGDPVLPVEALTAILKVCDVWVELDSSGLMFTTPYDRAVKENKKLRHICLGSADIELLVRCIGRVDLAMMYELERRLISLLADAKEIRITTPAGTDVGFRQHPKHPILGSGDLLTGHAGPGSYTLPGALAWAPDLDTVAGTIVFDGAIGVPAVNLSVLKSPIVLEVRAGKIVKISGGPEAKKLEAYLKSFNHPQTLRLAHTGLGFNPGAITRCRFGNMLEDERIWGATHWGIGEISAGLIPDSPVVAPMHCDGTCLASTVTADGVVIVEQGEFVHKDLVEPAKQLKVARV
jgi:2,5-dihydroxypyridine 5,6-dioxygenase